MGLIAPGTAAPDFTLKDVHDETFRFSALHEERAAVLVLNRGFLCPFCRRHMLRLREDYPEFRRRGAEIVVVGPEKPEAFRRHWLHSKLPFVGLPDPAGIVLDRYGQRSGLLSLGRLPAQFVIAPGGTVLFARYGKTMRDIPSNGELLAALGAPEPD